MPKDGAEALMAILLVCGVLFFLMVAYLVGQCVFQPDMCLKDRYEMQKVESLQEQLT